MQNDNKYGIFNINFATGRSGTVNSGFNVVQNEAGFRKGRPGTGVTFCFEAKRDGARVQVFFVRKNPDFDWYSELTPLIYEIIFEDNIFNLI